MIRIMMIDDDYFGSRTCADCSLDASMVLTYGKIGMSHHVSLCEDCAQVMSEELQTFNDLLEDEKEEQRWADELEAAANEDENDYPYTGPRDACDTDEENVGFVDEEELGMQGQDSEGLRFVDEYPELPEDTVFENEEPVKPLVISKEENQNDYEATPEKTIFECT